MMLRTIARIWPANDRTIVVRFAVVGTVATIVYFVIGATLYTIVDIPPVVVNSAAVIVAVLVSYVGHHRITFRRKGMHANYFPRFMFVTVTLFVLSNALTYFLVERSGVSPFLTTGLIAVLYPTVSYVVHRLWTFSSSGQATV